MTTQKGSATVILLVVLVVVLAGVLAYFVFLKKPGEVAVSPTATPTPTAIKTVSPSPISAWKTYTNGQYGFEITLTDTWKGYKVKERADVVYSSVRYFDISVPTTDKIWGSGSGYAAPFGIAVYPISVWQQIQNEEGPKPSFLKQNNNYVFAYYQWQDAPSDLINTNFQISQVVSTFKFTK